MCSSNINISFTPSLPRRRAVDFTCGSVSVISLLPLSSECMLQCMFCDKQWNFTEHFSSTEIPVLCFSVEGAGGRKTFSCSVQYILEVGVVAKKETKGIQTGKEQVKLSLFIYDMILHKENPNDSPKNLIVPIHVVYENSHVQDQWTIQKWD